MNKIKSLNKMLHKIRVMKLEFAHINPDENHNFNVENLSWSVNNNLEKIEFYLEMIIKLLKDNESISNNPEN